MTDERWRCFVAIPIGEALRSSLRAAVEGWRDVEGLRWTDPDGWHVTLAFLGSVEAASMPRLVDRLTAAAEGVPTMHQPTGGLGAFPTPARARVAWYGIHDEAGSLGRLAADVADALDLPSEAPFRPHLTLARARRQPVDLRRWLASASAPDGQLVVEALELMRSHTGSGLARYETQARVELGLSSRV